MTFIRWQCNRWLTRGTACIVLCTAFVTFDKNLLIYCLWHCSTHTHISFVSLWNLTLIYNYSVILVFTNTYLCLWRMFLLWMCSQLHRMQAYITLLVIFHNQPIPLLSINKTDRLVTSGRDNSIGLGPCRVVTVDKVWRPVYTHSYHSEQKVTQCNGISVVEQSGSRCHVISHSRQKERFITSNASSILDVVLCSHFSP